MLPELTNTMLCVGTAQILKESFFVVFSVAHTDFQKQCPRKVGQTTGPVVQLLTVSKIKSCKLWATYAIHMRVKPKS